MIFTVKFDDSVSEKKISKSEYLKLQGDLFEKLAFNDRAVTLGDSPLPLPLLFLIWEISHSGAQAALAL